MNLPTGSLPDSELDSELDKEQRNPEEWRTTAHGFAGCIIVVGVLSLLITGNCGWMWLGNRDAQGEPVIYARFAAESLPAWIAVTALLMMAGFGLLIAARARNFLRAIKWGLAVMVAAELLLSRALLAESSLDTHAAARFCEWVAAIAVLLLGTLILVSLRRRRAESTQPTKPEDANHP